MLAGIRDNCPWLGMLELVMELFGAVLQLAEAEQEIEAEHERIKAAEQALEIEKRRRQAAEFAQSRPASPFRDPALQTELASLRAQVHYTHVCCADCCRQCLQA